MVITKQPVRLLLTAFVGLLSVVAMANPVTDSAQVKVDTAHVAAEATHTAAEHEVKALTPEEEKKEKVTAFIEHHLQDSHDFTFFSDEKEGKHYGFSLPVILLDNGLKIFSSSKFHHGEEVAEVDGNYYKLYHGKIYKTDATGTITYDEHHHPTNAKPLDFSITKNVFSLLIVSAILLFMFTSLAKSYKKGPVPTGFGRVLEPLILFIRDEVAIPNIGEKKYRKFMGYLLTVFFLIWLLNLLGMTPLGINVTGNIAVTVCLAIFTYIITQFSANKDYWGHIFWMPGVPVPMKIILAPIEVLGTLTKPFALLIRLFANITAGHVVIMSLIAMIFVGKNLAADLPISLGLTLFISIIELLVAFLQAFIFTMLSSLFIGMAVQDHHHDDHEHYDGHDFVDNSIV
ncbi:F0F1 ATP synthase subunit A [Flavobacterium suncheonense]|uniref:ATP synthase subunit a n=1 Tax=Flavobacterium suncheonense GH29-5 = DSM 17707 TaxID=1121899 RepID=A0A0A2MBT1_9FLAO|nr:F0F1 ATP synthase subunit A [Flavobacterium suncheonense]KGO89096.1 ATP synthase F0 subunit A [Flavobacterium suncheonense GH29-5 = DSM 17707]